MRISDISIAARLCICALVPLLAVVALASHLVSDQYGAYSLSKRVAWATLDIEVISSATHRLQAERGSSAGFLGSKGEAGGAALADARAKVDAELPALKTAVGELIHLGLEPEQQRRIEQAFSVLSQTRADIDRLALAPQQSFSYYTGLIGDLLEVTRELALSEKKGSLESRLKASLDLAFAKELAGQERGMGNGFISAGRMPPEQFMNFAKYYGAGEILLDEFARLEPTLAGETLNRFAQGEEAATIAAYRRQLLQTVLVRYGPGPKGLMAAEIRFEQGGPPSSH